MPRQQCFKKRTIAVLVGAALVSGSSALYAAAATPVRLNTITPQDRQAAAASAAARGFKATVATGTTAPGGTTTGPGGAVVTGPGGAVGIMAVPGVDPRYFSHPNYANSPLTAAGAVVSVVNDPTDTTGGGAMILATADPLTGAINGFNIVSAGAGYTVAPSIVISSPAGGTGATATVTLNATGGIAAVALQTAGTGYLPKGGIRKFVDQLAGLGAAGANNLGQYIPVAQPDTTTYPGSDYYEIAVVQYREKLHSDLPATLLRGYVQLSTGVVPGGVALSNDLLVGSAPIAGHTGVDKPHYLGPTIIAQKDRPVRIKFYNLLPTGVDGNLFLPVDTTVMGAGMGPSMAGMMEPTPLTPMCGTLPKPTGCYTENRATLHLHGGVNPWISDGTPHQWITPAAEATALQQGVSVVPVPDMNDNGAAGDGSMTFYYTNQQSSRLMFYHDHSYGITRLNVYAGEAAGYLLTDATEQALVASGVIPADQIPLVIQDKTFVPNAAQRALEDETWDAARWGDEGSLWMPHVYSPAQNPGDMTGVNQFGRWAYGPWFWPPVQSEHGPIANPYYDAACNPDLTWCEPPNIPGTPNNSMGMEAFQDTPMVNGTVYPTVTVAPKAYRLRILNAAGDRFFNLSMFKAASVDPVTNIVTPCVAPAGLPPAGTVAPCTEVALNPTEVQGALLDPAGVFPTPMAGTEGPSWIQIGTEGGFLPAPVVIPPQVTTWVTDPTVFNAGNVDKHSLLLGPAERADVIVDFSAYAGQTLILYNDAPAAFPARDPRYDYYTGNPDLTSTGGAPATPAGYGPNTRTVMQIKVEGAPAPAYNVATLQAAFTHKPDGSGVFESSQHKTIVGQSGYNSAYGTAFTGMDGLAQIFNTSLTFKNLNGNLITIPLQPKQIQDEMGEAFEHKYGRMSGFLGVETPNPMAGRQNMILYPFPMPPTEVIQGLPPGAGATPIARGDDGTQIWKITHNGVDTHPIHFHLYDVQLLNRVGWDGIIRKPDANELGWKDTVRVSPLEDTIVALRPVMPTLPWELPNSVRLLDPTMPDGAILANTTQAIAQGKPALAFDPNGNPIDVINHFVNFGQEYVWHCHILSHEEMDMMRPSVVGTAPAAPTGLGVAVNGTTATLAWTDASINESGFVIQRASDAGFTTGLMQFQAPANATGYSDTTLPTNGLSYYRVIARNVIGDTRDYTDPALNGGASFPTLTMDSTASNTVNAIGTVPAAAINAPTNLVLTLQAGPRVRVTWRDRSNNETGFSVERAVNGGAFAVVGTTGANATSYFDTTVAQGNTYAYRVQAVNATGGSPYSPTGTVTVPLAAAAPTSLVASQVPGTRQVRLTWTDNANNESGFQIQRAQNTAFTSGLNTNTVRANVTTYTSGNLTRGRTYYFRVRATSTSGSSTWEPVAPAVIAVTIR